MAPEAFEDGGEARDDEGEQEDGDDGADAQDDDRIHHRGLDLGLQGLVALQIGGQPLQGDVQDASQFPGLDHGAVKLGEGVRVLAQRVRYGETALDISAHGVQDLLERRILRLRLQDGEALHEGDARADQGGKLPGKKH